MTKKVSIEIGHGGTDPGAVSGKILEKDINLNTGLELKRQLERHGVKVLINRTADVNDKATEFVKKAREFNPDAGISVHANAFNGTAKGFEVFRNTNAFKIVSNLLCAHIESEVKALGRISRGVKDSPFLMSSLSCPTAYCELGFLDNPADYKDFDDSQKQKAFGTAYAKGILNYFGIAWLPEKAVSAGGGERTMYRVIAGSFSEKANAQALVKALKTKGIDCFIAEYKN
ncbi:MAG: N-acetylmuramoyl-L-alanine amidase [Oscillospiraceae bacterium]|jgi:N-acetylmuramoyl-L-alanine amidase|nr:N-acetylmuramoyl-L-alanine amidase [Oscillospiraceae bacterium]